MSTTEAIELTMKEAQGHLDVEAALQRLNHNPDFKKIILQGYLQEEAVRLVHLKASPELDGPEAQTALLRDIDGIGALLGYFRKLQMQARYAQKAIEDCEKELEFMEEEGSEG